MSTPALSLPKIPMPAAPAAGQLRRLGPATLTLGAAALVGAALATGSMVMMAAAALPFLFGMLARPDSATLLFALCFYMNLPVIASNAGAGSVLGSAFVLLLIAPLVAHVVVGRRPLVFTPAIALMVGFLIAMVISALVGGGATPGSASDITVYLIEGPLLVLLIMNVVRTPGVLRNVIWMIMAAGAAMGLISLWQELTHSYSNTLHGLAQVESLKFTVMHGTDKVSRPRLAGPIGEKNRYAQILLVLLPLAVWLIRTERQPGLRLVAMGLSALTLCGALLTFSRGAFVALLFTTMVALGMRFLRLRHVLPIGLALIALMFAVAPDFVSRVQSLGAADTALSQDGTADAAAVGRATESLAAFNVFREHPLIGVGPGEFFRTYSQQAGNELNLRFLETRRHAHDLYLEMAADLGIIGLSLFLAIIIVTMVQLQRLGRYWASRGRPDLKQLTQALVLTLIAYMASGVFLQLSFQRYFWFLIALANATIWMLSRAARQQPATPVDARQARRLRLRDADPVGVR